MIPIRQTHVPIQVQHLMEYDDYTSSTTHQTWNDIGLDASSTHGTGHMEMRPCRHSYQHSALHFGTKCTPPQCNSGTMWFQGS